MLGEAENWLQRQENEIHRGEQSGPGRREGESRTGTGTSLRMNLISIDFSTVSTVL